jgi:hypothetical protein
MKIREGIIRCSSFYSLGAFREVPSVAVNGMSQMLLQLQDHLIVIIAECDMLEDDFSDRSDVMTRINVIKNAVHRIANAIDCQSRPPSEIFAEDETGPCAHVDVA